jgi:hypothetical protein
MLAHQQQGQEQQKTQERDSSSSSTAQAAAGQSTSATAASLQHWCQIRAATSKQRSAESVLKNTQVHHSN